jgi:hypothetical protein
MLTARVKQHDSATERIHAFIADVDTQAQTSIEALGAFRKQQEVKEDEI